MDTPIVPQNENVKRRRRRAPKYPLDFHPEQYAKGVALWWTKLAREVDESWPPDQRLGFEDAANGMHPRELAFWINYAFDHHEEEP